MNWDKIYLDHSKKMIGICRRYVESNDTAEDVAQEGFIHAMNKYHTFKNEGSFEGWLRRIMVTTSLQYLRKQKSEQKKQQKYYETNIPMDDRTQDSVLASAFTTQELLAAIEQLPEHHKNVFNLYVLDEFTHLEISEQLNISVNTSKSHLSRARKKLQVILHEKSKEKERKIGLLFLPTTEYIDSLFKTAFRDFEITPTKPFSFPSQNISGNSAKNIGWKTLVIFTGAAAIILIVGLVFFNKENKSKHPTIKNTIQTNENTQPEISTPDPSTPTIPNTIENSSSNELVQPSIEKKDQNNNSSKTKPKVYQKITQINETNSKEQSEEEITKTVNEAKDTILPITKPVVIKKPIIVKKQVIVQDTIKQTINE